MTIEYKRAWSSKGQCVICGKWVRRGEYFWSSGTDGHGDLTGLVHKDCKIKAEGKEG